MHSGAEPNADFAAPAANGAAAFNTRTHGDATGFSIGLVSRAISIGRTYSSGDGLGSSVRVGARLPWESHHLA